MSVFFDFFVNSAVARPIFVYKHLAGAVIFSIDLYSTTKPVS